MPACSSSQLTCSLCCTRSRPCDELSAMNTKCIAVGSGDGYQGEVTNHEWTRLRQGYGAAGTNRREFSDGRLTTDYADCAGWLASAAATRAKVPLESISIL